MDSPHSGNGDRRKRDNLLNLARLVAAILIGVVPVVFVIAAVFYDWHLTAEWVSLYVVGIVGGAATLFGLANLKNGK